MELDWTWGEIKDGKVWKMESDGKWKGEREAGDG